MPPHGFVSLRVKRVVDETADTRSFVLDVTEEHAADFVYRAGQFCTFRVSIGGEELLRSYSMSSAPETDPELTVTVKRVPGGAVSNHLIDTVRPGDRLELTRPAGVFCLDPAAGERPVVAFCGGSGVTPVISIVKAALSATARPVRVLYANRSRSSVIFSAELDSMSASSGGRLEVVHHYDDVAGFLDTGAVRHFVGSGTDGDFYVCGPQPFMDLVESVLLDAGVAPERVHIERFGAAPLPPDPDPLSPAGVVTETVTIIMKGRKHRCGYQPGHTLLETARRAGLKPPFSCESGTCATCMAIVHDGSVTMRVNEALTPEEVDEGWVLTCQALPTSPDITFEYESY